MKTRTKLPVCLAAVIALPLPLFAKAPPPRYVLTTAYIYEIPSSTAAGRFSANGWAVSPQLNFNSWFGLSVGVGGAYGNPMGISNYLYSFHGGPVFTFPGHDHFVPWTAADLGDAYSRVANGPGPGAGIKTTNDFQVIYGGGLDYRKGHNFGVRLIEIDDSIVFSSGSTKQTPIFSAGLVFKWGKIGQ